MIAHRNNRRRSRQCRGSRARNYNRTVVRAAKGANPDAAVKTIIADAEQTGALAAARRQQVQR